MGARWVKRFLPNAIEALLYKLPDTIYIRGIAKAIVDAKRDGYPYKFVIADKPPDSRLQERLDSLNANIRSIDPDFPEFTTADVLVESLK